MFIIFVSEGIENKFGISLIGYNSCDIFSFSSSRLNMQSGFNLIYLIVGS